LEARKRCVIWTSERHAAYDPEDDVEDRNGRVYDLQNIGLLDLKFDQNLANKLVRLLHN
jgi:hypothetical protein